MLTQKLANAMQRVLSKDVDRFPLTASLQSLVDADIGMKLGKSVYFTDVDRIKMRDWLEAKGYAIQLSETTGLKRSEMLSLTPNEKAGGEAVKRNRISIKSLHGHPLRLGEEFYVLPDEGNIDVDWTKIVELIKHQSIMVVENYENFNRIHETKFELSEEFGSPLVLYHGDPHESRLDNVQRFLTHAKLPVLAFMDIDPAGIAMASRLPNLAAIIAPRSSVLEQQLSSPKTGRRDLFQSQYATNWQALDDLPVDSACLPLWEMIKRHRSGIVQERWIGQPDSCILWTPNSEFKPETLSGVLTKN